MNPVHLQIDNTQLDDVDPGLSCAVRCTWASSSAPRRERSRVLFLEPLLAFTLESRQMSRQRQRGQQVLLVCY